MEERIVAETEENIAAEVQVEATPAPMPMAWHKFQKNFLLWLIALFYAARAFLTASGNIYYEASIRDAIYAGMPLLRVLDYIFAAHCATMGALGVISALRLNKGSAGLLLKTNLIMAIGELGYMLIRWLISGLPPVNLQSAALLAVHALLAGLNRAYYRKRTGYAPKEKNHEK